MTAIVTILTDGFADWETALLNGAARAYYRITTQYASPGGRTVISMGGLQATPDLALEAVDPDQFDALIVCGGTGWQSPDAPDLRALLAAAHARGKVVAAICDGTVALARTGLLDQADHTSNGPGYLDSTGYRGKAHYRDVPCAVSDKRIVTASATAPVSFMAEVMRTLGLDDADLDYFLAMHAAQHETRKAA
jgi:putative intracellular protease/amidase